MAATYKSLEGKEIKYFGGTKWYTGIIVGCNKDIGITVVDKNNPERKLICHNGPATKAYKENKIKKKNHLITFKKRIEKLRTGVYISSREISDLYYGHITSNMAPMAPCPFSGI